MYTPREMPSNLSLEELTVWLQEEFKSLQQAYNELEERLVSLEEI